MTLRWRAVLAPRRLALCSLYVLLLSCGEHSDSASHGLVGSVLEALTGAAGGPAATAFDAGVASRAGHCVQLARIDSVPDGVDEDCDGRIDEDVTHRPSDCPAGYAVIQGTRGDDVLTGTNGNDCILGFGGDDILRGGNGDDLLFGGQGDDQIDTGDGKDVVYGDDGDDDIDCGNAKESVVYGGAGNDLVQGGNGKDVIYGGDGNDHLLGGNGKDALYGEGCNDWLEGGLGVDTVVGGPGYDACDESGCETLDTAKRNCTTRSDCRAGELCAEHVWMCVPESVGACNGCTPTANQDVTCDGVDDDCDTRVDDDFVPAATSCGRGECANVGSTACVGGKLLDSCSPKPSPGPDTTCDGRDQNCDGRADEGYLPLPSHCGVGACANDGQWICSATGLQDTCQPLPAAARDAVCDGLDEDCDSRIDEDFVGSSLLCGRGFCARELATQCVSGQVQGCPERLGCEDACENGQDDDFDGRADCADPDCAGESACLIGHGCAKDRDCQGTASSASDLSARCDLSVPGGYCVRPCGPEQTCPQGSVCLPNAKVCALPCKADGTCDNAALSCQTWTAESGTDHACRPSCAAASCGAGSYCDPTRNLCSSCQQQDASCDGVDQDCDGRADDDYVVTTTHCGLGICANTGLLRCSEGQELNSCSPRPSSPDDNCNGLDDDCNGLTDDAYPVTITHCGSGACAATGQIACIGGQVLPDNCMPRCEGICNNAVDDDRDRAIDCQDPDCNGQPVCSIKLGDHCSADTDCLGLGAAPKCIRELPGGYCSSSCASDADCQTPGVCAGGQCWIACAADRTCADPTAVCTDFGASQRPICHQGCSAGCAQGTYCNPSVQLCQACLATDTTCDGTDDDCDGRVDDDVPTATTSCGGTGLCASSGVRSCINGRMQDSCVPRDLGDGDPCTTDTCDPATGKVAHAIVVGISCDDGNVCNGSEMCQATRTPILPFTRLSPFWTYLRTSSDFGAIDAKPLLLSSLGIAPGQRIVIARQGSHSNGMTSMGAVFSSSATLLSAGLLARVPGAIASDAPAAISPKTLFDALPTDIPQDFFVPGGDGVEVGVPTGATYLFISAIDGWYYDNSDPDGDFGYRIERPGSACVVTQPAPIDDGNACTLDLCTPQAGITHVPAAAGSTCSDGNVCTNESCDGAGACRTTPVEVSDNDPCTADSCSPSTGVVHTRVSEGTSCSDSNVCNGLEVCKTVPWNEYREQVNPRGSFWPYDSQYPMVLKLASYGMKAGDRISMRATGSYLGLNPPENQLVGVFSSSEQVLPISSSARVPGALQSDAPALAGEIPQDFRIPQTAVQATIPAGAAYLIIGAYESRNEYSENYDSDGDFALIFTLAAAPKFGCQPGVPLTVDDGNACTADSCNPSSGVTHTTDSSGAATCASLGRECGTADNGCGQTLDCGNCEAPKVCGSQQPGKCGAPALPSPAALRVSRRFNVAQLESGADVIEPADADAAINGVNGGYDVANTPAPKVFTVDLMGDVPRAIEEVSFIWSGNADRAEVWISDEAPFQAQKLVRVADQTIAGNGTTQTIKFSAVRARFLRLVVSWRTGTANVTGRLSALKAFTRDRDGGITSLVDGDAHIVAASSERVSSSTITLTAFNAFEANDASRWETNGSSAQWVIVQLGPSGMPVDQLELRDFNSPDTTNLKDFVLELSSAGTADADFHPVLNGVGTRMQDWAHVYEFTPTPAKYARLRLLTNYGGSNFVVQRVRLFSQAFGGAVVPFEDVTDLASSSTATRLWSFGDGTTSTEITPLHTYPGPGTYAVSLTVTDSQGRIGTARSTYTVLPAPTAAFDWTPATVEEAYFKYSTLTNSSTPAPGARMLYYGWSSPSALFQVCGSFGCVNVPDSFTISGEQTTLPFYYPQSGTYAMQLKVTDARYMTSTLVKQIDVLNVPPSVNAGADVSTLWGDAIGMGFGTQAVDDKGALDKALLRCLWSFGDGATQKIEPCDVNTDTFVGHTYANPGVYTATLTAFDDVSSNSDTLTVSVGRRPTTVVPLSMEPTEQDGVFELTARVYDTYDDARPIAGAVVEFHHAGGVISALTDETSTARVRVQFEPLSYGAVEYAFLGNDRYLSSSDSLDMLVRQGDTTPLPVTDPATSAEGQRFVLAFPQNADYAHYTTATRRVTVMLSARANTTAAVRVPALGFQRTVAVSANAATAVVLPEGVRMGNGNGTFNSGDSGVIENKGVEITSPVEITVHAYDQIVASSDGYLALPVERLGTDYLLLGMHNEKVRGYSEPNGSQLGIVAVEPDTHVTIVPTADIGAGPQLPNGALRGQSTTITLGALQTFQGLAPSKSVQRYEDLTGTRITSDKPIAVYGGHVCTSLSNSWGACNHVIEQMPPVEYLGKHFLTTPMQVSSLRGIQGDFLRVLAAYDSTEVRFDGKLVATLKRGETYNTLTGYVDGAHEITTSQPSLVAQYMRGANIRDPSQGDPAYMLVPPSTQYVDRVVLSRLPPLMPTLRNPFGYSLLAYATVIAKASEVGNIRLDGLPLTAAWKIIGNSAYAAARFEITSNSQVLSTAKLGVKFMAFAYGYNSFDSYALPLGMDLAHTECRPTRTTPGDGVDNDCDGVEGEERKNGLDDDGDGVPDEDLALERDASAPNHAPSVANTVYEDVSGSFSYAIPGYDEDGDTLSYRIVSLSPSAGAFSATLTGERVVFTGDLPASGLTINVVANDGKLDSAPGKLTIKVGQYGCKDPLASTTARCNEIPYLWANEFEGQVIKVPTGRVVAFSNRINALDVDLQSVRYQLTKGPAGLTLDPSTGVVKWLVDSTMLGTYEVRYRMQDLYDITGEQSVQLTVVADTTNTPPVLDSTPVSQVGVNQAYSYAIVAHDAENQALSYKLVAGPSAMGLAGSTLSWTPTQTDVGQHAVLIRVNDSVGGSTVQSWNLTVTGSPLVFVSSPSLLAAVGVEYQYKPEVARAIGPSTLQFNVGGGAPSGMRLNEATGELLWTPTAEQLDTYAVELKVRDADGNVGTQFFSIEVSEQEIAPRIVSEPVTQAVLHGQYVYDVDGADLGKREVLSYQLLQGPAGMGIDMVTGRVTWMPEALGSYLVRVQVQDSHGSKDVQEYVLEVVPDTSAPQLDVQFSSQIVALGETLTLTALAQDDVGVTSVVVTIDGVPVALDASGHVQWTGMTSGAHELVVTALDLNGNQVQQSWTLGVRDDTDAEAPVVVLTSPTEDQEVTYVHDVLGTVSDTNLLDYTVELRRVGDSAYKRIGGGTTSITGKLGTLDTTLLQNGYYELRVRARDVNERESSAQVLVRVGGQAKPGVVQLSFVDAVVPMAGIPLSVVRSYDSRDKGRGEFGYGWRLSLSQGAVQHNRTVGDGIAIYTQKEDFALPCQGVYEQQSHFTEVRLSEREHYIFRPFVSNPEGISGGCEADIGFELVEGSTQGAELLIVGDATDTRVRAPALPIVQNPERLPHSTLTYALTPERGAFNPGLLQLVLRDGRKFNLDVERGLVRVQDADGNALELADNGLHHTGGKSVFFTRDAQGRISRITDPAGRVVSYGYDLAGDLVFVENPLAERTRFVYRSDIAHHLQDVYDAAGTRVAAMDYDASGRLTKTCDAEGACGRSSYDLAERSVVQTDATSRPVKYKYDLRGNVTSQTDGLNYTTSFAYDAFDNLIRAEGPDGSVATYTYDGNRQMLTRVLPHEADEPAADFTYSYAYTSGGQRSKVTLPTGASLHFEFDANGHPTATRDDAGNVIESSTYNADGTLATRTDRFGTVRYEAYQNGQPTRIVDAFGVPATLVYDPMGRLLSRSERGLTSTFTYDALGRPTKRDYGNGAVVSFGYTTGAPDWTSIEGPTFGKVTRSFTSTGRLGSWTEPNGDAFTRLYDGSGRVQEEIDALGNHTTYGYDAAGQLSDITDVSLGATTHFVRDAAGRVTDTTDALGHTTHTSYKLGGRLESTTNARGKTTSFDRTPLSASITDALKRTTVTSLSTYGLPLGTTYAGGSDTTSNYLGTTRLDGSQQFPTSFEDELERSRSYGYDSKSGLTSATDLAGQSWQYQYTPAAGSGVSYDVSSGSVTASQQDNGATAYQSAGGGTEYRDVPTAGESDGGNISHMLSQVTSPMGEVTKFERGANGRISKVTYPDGGTRTISYDAANRPQTITLPQGTVVTFGHDSLGRETSRTTSTGEFRYLTYGVGDRIETMTDNTGTTTYSYDSAGRFSGITYPTGASVKYTRDKLDRTTDVRVTPKVGASEIVTHYDYDEDGNLAQIIDPKGGVTGYSYDDADRLEQRLLPNGVVTTYTYDSRDRVLSVVHKNASNVVLASVVYVRSNSGEPTKITREDGTYTTVEYDSALRISKESEHDANDVLLAETSYRYDADGNRTSKTTLTGSETYSYSAGFKLESITGPNGTETYTHDAGGRLIGMDRDGSSKTLTYDSMDHITQVTGGGVDESYEFDGMGRRVGITTAGYGSRKLLVAPNLGDGYESPQAVTDANGDFVAAFVFAGEHPIAKITPSGVEYFLADSVGSAIGKANSAGASIASIKYDAFGGVLSAVGIDSAVGAEPRFQGMTLDTRTGLYFVRARTYDSRTGRFLSRDPIAGITYRPESLHAYIFCNSNPNVWRDPSGAFSLLEATVTVTAVATMTSIALPALNQQLKGVRSFRTGVGYSVTDYTVGMTDFLSFTAGKAMRDLVGLSGEVDAKSGAYLAGMATGFAMQIWRSFLTGVAVGMSRAGWVAAEDAGRGITAESLAGSTAGIPRNGHKMLGAAQILSRAPGLSPAQKLELMKGFFRQIGFGFETKPGQAMILYSEDYLYAFDFAADGRIVYGKMTEDFSSYVWSAM